MARNYTGIGKKAENPDGPGIPDVSTEPTPIPSSSQYNARMAAQEASKNAGHATQAGYETSDEENKRFGWGKYAETEAPQSEENYGSGWYEEPRPSQEDLEAELLSSESAEYKQPEEEVIQPEETEEVTEVAVQPKEEQTEEEDDGKLVTDVFDSGKKATEGPMGGRHNALFQTYWDHPYGGVSNDFIQSDIYDARVGNTERIYTSYDREEEDGTHYTGAFDLDNDLEKSLNALETFVKDNQYHTNDEMVSYERLAANLYYNIPTLMDYYDEVIEQEQGRLEELKGLDKSKYEDGVVDTAIAGQADLIKALEGYRTSLDHNQQFCKSAYDQLCSLNDWYGEFDDDKKTSPEEINAEVEKALGRKNDQSTGGLGYFSDDDIKHFASYTDEDWDTILSYYADVEKNKTSFPEYGPYINMDGEFVQVNGEYVPYDTFMQKYQAIKELAAAAQTTRAGYDQRNADIEIGRKYIGTMMDLASEDRTDQDIIDVWQSIYDTLDKSVPATDADKKALQHEKNYVSEQLESAKKTAIVNEYKGYTNDQLREELNRLYYGSKSEPSEQTTSEVPDIVALETQQASLQKEVEAAYNAYEAYVKNGDATNPKALEAYREYTQKNSELEALNTTLENARNTITENGLGIPEVGDNILDMLKGGAEPNELSEDDQRRADVIRRLMEANKMSEFYSNVGGFPPQIEKLEAYADQQQAEVDRITEELKAAEAALAEAEENFNQEYGDTYSFRYYDEEDIGSVLQGYNASSENVKTLRANVANLQQQLDDAKWGLDSARACLGPESDPQYDEYVQAGKSAFDIQELQEALTEASYLGGSTPLDSDEYVEDRDEFGAYNYLTNYFVEHGESSDQAKADAKRMLEMLRAPGFNVSMLTPDLGENNYQEQKGWLGRFFDAAGDLFTGLSRPVDMNGKEVKPFTQGEIDNFYYLLGKKGAAAAAEYAFGVQNENTREYNQELRDRYRSLKDFEAGFKSKGQLTAEAAVAPVTSWVLGLGGLPETVKTLMQTAALGDSIAKSGLSFSQLSDAINESATRGLMKAYPSIPHLEFWYGVYNSTITSLLTMSSGSAVGEMLGLAGQTITIGGKTVDALKAFAGAFSDMYFFGSAAASDYNELLDRGVDPQKAAITSAFSGVFEAMFEHISFDQLWDAKNVMDYPTEWYKALLEGGYNTLVSAGIEGSEELFTNWANRIGERIFLGADSKYESNKEQYYQEYINNGMDPAKAREEASKKAMHEALIDDALAAAAGSLSGGFSVGGRTAKSLYVDRAELRGWRESNGHAYNDVTYDGKTGGERLGEYLASYDFGDTSKLTEESQDQIAEIQRLAGKAKSGSATEEEIGRLAYLTDTYSRDIIDDFALANQVWFAGVDGHRLAFLSNQGMEALLGKEKAAEYMKAAMENSSVNVYDDFKKGLKESCPDLSNQQLILVSSYLQDILRGDSAKMTPEFIGQLLEVGELSDPAVQRYVYDYLTQNGLVEQPAEEAVVQPSGMTPSADWANQNVHRNGEQRAEDQRPTIPPASQTKTTPETQEENKPATIPPAAQRAEDQGPEGTKEGAEKGKPQPILPKSGKSHVPVLQTIEVPAEVTQDNIGKVLKDVLTETWSKMNGARKNFGIYYNGLMGMQSAAVKALAEGAAEQAETKSKGKGKESAIKPEYRDDADSYQRGDKTVTRKEFVEAYLNGKNLITGKTVKSGMTEERANKVFDNTLLNAVGSDGIPLKGVEVSMSKFDLTTRTPIGQTEETQTPAEKSAKPAEEQAEETHKPSEESAKPTEESAEPAEESPKEEPKPSNIPPADQVTPVEERAEEKEEPTPIPPAAQPETSEPVAEEQQAEEVTEPVTEEQPAEPVKTEEEEKAERVAEVQATELEKAQAELERIDKEYSEAVDEYKDNINQRWKVSNELENLLKTKKNLESPNGAALDILDYVRKNGKEVHTIFGEGTAYAIDLPNNVEVVVEYSKGSVGAKNPIVYMYTGDGKVTLVTGGKKGTQSFGTTAAMVAFTNTWASPANIVKALGKLKGDSVSSTLDILSRAHNKRMASLDARITQLQGRVQAWDDVVNDSRTRMDNIGKDLDDAKKDVELWSARERDPGIKLQNEVDASKAAVEDAKKEAEAAKTEYENFKKQYKDGAKDRQKQLDEAKADEDAKRKAAHEAAEEEKTAKNEYKEAADTAKAKSKDGEERLRKAKIEGDYAQAGRDLAEAKYKEKAAQIAYEKAKAEKAAATNSKAKSIAQSVFTKAKKAFEAARNVLAKAQTAFNESKVEYDKIQAEEKAEQDTLAELESKKNNAHQKTEDAKKALTDARDLTSDLKREQKEEQDKLKELERKAKSTSKAATTAENRLKQAQKALDKYNKDGEKRTKAEAEKAKQTSTPDEEKKPTPIPPADQQKAPVSAEESAPATIPPAAQPETAEPVAEEQPEKPKTEEELLAELESINAELESMSSGSTADRYHHYADGWYDGKTGQKVDEATVREWEQKVKELEDRKNEIIEQLPTPEKSEPTPATEEQPVEPKAEEPKPPADENLTATAKDGEDTSWRSWDDSIHDETTGDEITREVFVTRYMNGLDGFNGIAKTDPKTAAEANDLFDVFLEQNEFEEKSNTNYEDYDSGGRMYSLGSSSLTPPPSTPSRVQAEVDFPEVKKYTPEEVKSSQPIGYASPANSVGSAITTRSWDDIFSKADGTTTTRAQFVADFMSGRNGFSGRRTAPVSATVANAIFDQIATTKVATGGTISYADGHATITNAPTQKRGLGVGGSLAANLARLEAEMAEQADKDTVTIGRLQVAADAARRQLEAVLNRNVEDVKKEVDAERAKARERIGAINSRIQQLQKLASSNVIGSELYKAEITSLRAEQQKILSNVSGVNTAWTRYSAAQERLDDARNRMYASDYYNYIGGSSYEGPARSGNNTNGQHNLGRSGSSTTTAGSAGTGTVQSTAGKGGRRTAKSAKEILSESGITSKGSVFYDTLGKSPADIANDKTLSTGIRNSILRAMRNGVSRVIITSGKLFNNNGQSVNGYSDTYMDGDTERSYIIANRAKDDEDSVIRTAAVIDHEYVHHLLSAMTPENRVNFVKTVLKAAFGSRKDLFDAVFNAYKYEYARAYGEEVDEQGRVSETLANKIYEEMVADLYGGISMYGNNKELSAAMRELRLAAYGDIRTIFESEGLEDYSRSKWLHEDAEQTTLDNFGEVSAPFDQEYSPSTEQKSAPGNTGQTESEDIDKNALRHGEYFFDPQKNAYQVRLSLGNGETVDVNNTEIGSYDLKDFSKAQNMGRGPLFNINAMNNDEPIYKEMLKQWGGMTDLEIDNLFDIIDTATVTIMENLEALDYAWDADIDDRGFAPVKPNSDKLYKVSLDFSTLCRKRLLQMAVQNELQAALDRAITKDEGIAIRNALVALQETGLQIEVACALCYVESARMKTPEQIQKFLDNREAVLRDYFANKGGKSAKQLVNDADMAEREKIAQEYGDENGMVVGKNGKLYDVRDPKATPKKYLPTPLFKRITAARQAGRAQYKMTPEQRAIVDLANQMTISDFTSPKGLENLAKNHREIFDAYTSFVRAAAHSKGIEGDTWWRAGDSATIGDRLIEQMNAENGLRTQSWSDFQVKHLMDYIGATIELSTRGAQQHAYTKVPDYVDLMGNTGVMINMSLIPARDYLGYLDYDDVEGFIYDKAMELRDKFHETAGTICIGIKNEQIEQLMASDKIDYIIPYHQSGMGMHTRIAMNIPTWDDYQHFQNEMALNGADAQKNAERYGVKLLAETDENWHNAPKFSDWFDLETARQDARIAGKSGEYGIMTGGYVAMQKAAQKYKQLCAERGLAPKFSYGRADFSKADNYWKLLIDRKMVDNITGEIIEQKPLKPIFELETVNRILNDELARYGPVKEDQDKATRYVTQAFLSGDLRAGMKLKDIRDVMQKTVDNISTVNITENSEDSKRLSLDFDYTDAIITGRMDDAQAMVDKEARRHGYKKHAYHGTLAYGFNEFRMISASEMGVHFGTEAAARVFYNNTYKRKGFGDNPGIYDVYLKMENTLKTPDVWGDREALDSIIRKIDSWIENGYNEHREGAEDVRWTKADSRKLRDALKINDDYYAYRNACDEWFEETQRYEDADEYVDPITGKVYNSEATWDLADAEATKLGLTKTYARDGEDGKKTFYATDNRRSRETELFTLYASYEGIAVKDREDTAARKANQLAQTYLLNLGFDSIRYINEMEDIGSESYIILKPENIKRADTITYDDDGNVIPLSERFDDSKKDIRYSILHDVVDTDGNTYDDVIRMAYPEDTSIYDTRIGLKHFARQALAGKTVGFVDQDGKKEEITFARRGETTDKHANPHAVLDELSYGKLSGPVSRVVYLNAEEVLEASKFQKHMKQNPDWYENHDWLDENGWDWRTGWVMDKDNKLYPFTLHIAKTRDGRSILYDAYVGTKNAVEVHIEATAKNNPGEDFSQVPVLPNPLDTQTAESNIPQNEPEVKPDYSNITGNTAMAEALRRAAARIQNGAGMDSEESFDLGDTEGRDGSFSIAVENPDTLRVLNEAYENGDVVYTYKTFLKVPNPDNKGQFILLPPMAGLQKDEHGNTKLAHGLREMVWEESIGNPNSKSLKKEWSSKEGKYVWKYTLTKSDVEKSDVPAAFNPYQHSSDVVLNDQFKIAFQRPGLVTYLCVIPKSELTSGYHFGIDDVERATRADGEVVVAKDPVGKHSWKSGDLASQLTQTNRDVYLSRWLMPVREIPNEDVARMYKEIIDKEIHYEDLPDVGVPFNVVPPGLLTELEKIGVKIDLSGAGLDEDKYRNYLNAVNAERVAKNLEPFPYSYVDGNTRSWDRYDRVVRSGGNPNKPKGKRPTTTASGATRLSNKEFNPKAKGKYSLSIDQDTAFDQFGEEVTLPDYNPEVTQSTLSENLYYSTDGNTAYYQTDSGETIVLNNVGTDSPEAQYINRLEAENNANANTTTAKPYTIPPANRRSNDGYNLNEQNVGLRRGTEEVSTPVQEGTLRRTGSAAELYEESGPQSQESQGVRYSIPGPDTTETPFYNANGDVVTTAETYPYGSLERAVVEALKANDLNTLEEEIDDMLDREGVSDRVLEMVDEILEKHPNLTESEREALHKRVEEYREKYGTMPSRKNPKRDVHLPQSVDEETKLMKNMQTHAQEAETEWLSDEIVHEALTNEILSYVPMTNKEALQVAENHIKQHNGNYEVLAAQVHAWMESGQRVKPWQVAVGELLLKSMETEGQADKAIPLVVDLALIAHDTGQALQAFNILRKATPRGQLYYLQGVINQLNKRYERQINNGKMTKIHLPEDAYDRLVSCETRQELNNEVEAIKQEIAKQIPVSWADRWNAWRYLAMLGNPRTHIRNLFGNAMFKPAVFIKDMIATYLEERAVKSGRLSPEERTKIRGANLDKNSIFMKKAQEDFEEMYKIIVGEATGNKYADANDILSKRDIFGAEYWLGGKVLDWLNKKNSDLLTREDVIFLQKYYTKAFANYLQAQGVTEKQLRNKDFGANKKDRDLIAKARAWAVIEAQRNTYRDANAVAQTLNHLKGSSQLANVLLEGLVPFTKTPANILARGIEYSPFGLIGSITRFVSDMHSGKTSAECLDRLAAGMTGTGIMLLGLLMASIGIAGVKLRGEGPDDEELDAFEKLQGRQAYSLEIPWFGGKIASYTIDWLAPAALPLFVGVKVYDLCMADKNGADIEDIGAMILGIVNPMSSLSMLDGINSLLENISQADDENKMMVVVASMLTSYFTQGVPTFGGQLARSIDPYQRQTFVQHGTSNQGLQRTWQTSVIGKIPFLEQSKMAYVDEWGRKNQKTTVLEWLGGAIENFFSPGYANIINTTAVDEELQRLYDATKNDDVLPDRMRKYFSIGKDEERNLTADEYEQMLITNGQTAYALIEELMNTEYYNSLSDAEKAIKVAECYELSQALAKQEAEPEYNLPESWMNMAKQIGLADYMMIKDDLQASRTHEQLFSYLASNPDLTRDQITTLVANEYSAPDKIASQLYDGYNYTITTADEEAMQVIFEEELKKGFKTLDNDPKFTSADPFTQGERTDNMYKQARENTNKRYAEILDAEGRAKTAASSTGMGNEKFEKALTMTAAELNVDLGQGNIDLNSHSTENMVVRMDGMYYVLPATEGMTPEEAIEQFQKTNEYFGAFNNASAANSYSKRIVNDQKQKIARGWEPSADDIAAQAKWLANGSKGDKVISNPDRDGWNIALTEDQADERDARFRAAYEDMYRRTVTSEQYGKLDTTEAQGLYIKTASENLMDEINAEYARELIRNGEATEEIGKPSNGSNADLRNSFSIADNSYDDPKDAAEWLSQLFNGETSVKVPSMPGYKVKLSEAQKSMLRDNEVARWNDMYVQAANDPTWGSKTSDQKNWFRQQMKDEVSDIEQANFFKYLNDNGIDYDVELDVANSTNGDLWTALFDGTYKNNEIYDYLRQRYESTVGSSLQNNTLDRNQKLIRVEAYMNYLKDNNAVEKIMSMPVEKRAAAYESYHKSATNAGTNAVKSQTDIHKTTEAADDVRTSTPGWGLDPYLSKPMNYTRQLDTGSTPAVKTNSGFVIPPNNSNTGTKATTTQSSTTRDNTKPRDGYVIPPAREKPLTSRSGYRYW